MQRRQIFFITFILEQNIWAMLMKRRSGAFTGNTSLIIIISTMHHYPKEIIAARSCKSTGCNAIHLYGSVVVKKKFIYRLWHVSCSQEVGRVQSG